MPRIYVTPFQRRVAWVDCVPEINQVPSPTDEADSLVRSGVFLRRNGVGAERVSRVLELVVGEVEGRGVGGPPSPDIRWCFRAEEHNNNELAALKICQCGSCGYKIEDTYQCAAQSA
jgi:hypothetical protein